VKSAIFALAIGGFVMSIGSAFANSDDAKWVAQCIKDNKDAKVNVSVVTTYCTCMNDKMDENETKSISQWEKTHKKEMHECEKKAGWE